ncbi:MAG: hypothetical protein PHQ40_02215 [Anaerolineaceae bacterium]|nr:hypothetical protein [Anaerolineaceae bacterium]
MFYGKQIEEVVELFNQRQVKIFHSCQFIDYQSYIPLGGIPSRRLLEEHRLPFTAFDTDEHDRENSVWDKVFANPLDYGASFEDGKDAIPTIYGPIAFEFFPEALLLADDVAISIQSGGGFNFNREHDSLQLINDLNETFKYPANAYPKKRRELRTKSELRKRFGIDYAVNPEISLTMKGELLPFDCLHRIVVDPHFIARKSLVEIVKTYSAGVNFHPEIIMRQLPNSQAFILQELSCILENDVPTLIQISNNEALYSDTQHWASRLSVKTDMLRQWYRYATYLRNGTLLPILNEQMQ